MIINFITLGCSKNIVDTEVIAARFVEAGDTVLFESTENSDVVIINTCSFIHDAKEESIEEIFVHIKRKQQHAIKKIYIIGCLAQRYKDELIKILPEVDGIFSFSELNKLLNVNEFDLLQNTCRIQSTPTHYAYLKVSEGCSKECAFCAIPQIRGKHVSKPMNLICEEAEKLAERGVKELILIAQDLTYYGIDISERRELAKLLRKLAGIQGLKWIRLHYAYPIGFPYDILDVMSEFAVFCKYLDIPLQHISENVLRSMRRGGTPQQIYKLVETIRNKLPDIALRTTLISGYPVETKKDHQDLVDFVRNIRFERLGVFAYSQEENTPAFALGDPIKVREKNRRIKEIMTLQEQISLENNQKKIGSVINVVIDNEEDNHYFGRTEFDSPEIDNSVIIPKKSILQTGAFYPVLITGADNYDIFGKVII